MELPKIQKEEFVSRIAKIQEALERQGLDAMLVYGDEYRKETLRYVCNFWPIFERGACLIPRKGDPIFAGAPEGEIYAKSMCVWDDVRNIKEFACVSGLGSANLAAPRTAWAGFCTHFYTFGVPGKGLWKGDTTLGPPWLSRSGNIGYKTRFPPRRDPSRINESF